MADTAFDVIVIGGGPAGYPCAIRAAQNKLTVACIDEWKNHDGSYAFGGTCLNAGCIPSKALLESSELYHRAHADSRRTASRRPALAFDVAAMQKRKAGIVKTMTSGIAALFKAAGVTALQGHGKLLPGNASNSRRPTARRRCWPPGTWCWRSGSAPMELKSLPFDGKHDRRFLGRARVRRGAEAPRRDRRRRHRPGARQRLAPARRRSRRARGAGAVPGHGRPGQVAKEALKHFKKQGLDIRLGAKVSGADVRAGRRRRQVHRREGRADRDRRQGGRRGRPPALHGRTCSARARACELDARGFIKVDDHCRTGAGNVWAVGDGVRGPMLAHKGKEEGVTVGDLIAGRYAEVNYDVVPSVIYTAPEIAWVGQTEEQVKASGRAYKVGSFPFAASGRARAMEAPAGFCKLVARQDDDEILGVHIIGPMAGELIAEAVLAMEYSASTEDLQRTMHAHPTLTEALHEAALAADKRAIDIPNK